MYLTKHSPRNCQGAMPMEPDELFKTIVAASEADVAPRFWCCYSLDHIARAPRLDGPSHNETSVGPRPYLGAWEHDFC